MDRQNEIPFEGRVILSIALFSFLILLIPILVILLAVQPFTMSNYILWRASLLGVISTALVSAIGYLFIVKIIIPRRYSKLNDLERSHEDLTGDPVDMILEEKVLERTKELRNSEERYKSLWENAEDAMIRIDLDKKVTDANKREEDFLGYPRGDLLGKEICCILPAEYHNIFDKIFKETLRGEKAATQEVNMVTNKRGILAMELDMRGISNGNSISAAQIHLRDITGRKNLEQQLMRAEKMAVLSRFTTTLAHDLRNPVIGIKKTIEMMQQRSMNLNEDTTKKIFSDLITSSDLLLGMINDVLDLYQDSYKELPLLLYNFFMAETLEEVVKLLRFQIEEKRVFIEIDGPMELFIRGDKRRLQRVFINLLDNAIKFSPNGGRIKIRYRPVIEDNLRHLYFEVADEGPGIRPEDLDRIFEPFFVGEMAKTFKKGAGLGLCFCKAIVEAHHGRIWAKNRENGGALFCIRLPIEGEGVG